MAQTTRKTRMYDPWGYQEENNYESSENQFEIELNELFASAVYNGLDKKIHFFNNDGKELSGSTIDTSQFSTGVIQEAYYDTTTKELVIVFENGDVVRINMAEIIDQNEFADGLQVVDGIVSIKIDDSGEGYLTVSENGLKISGVNEAIAIAVEAEKNRAEAAEQALDAKIDQEITDRAADVDAEEARATAAEEALDAKIDQEIADRAADVNAEEARATAAEQALDVKIVQEITDRTADVDAEETRAKAAETVLSQQITSLNSELDAEESIREAADVALGLRIDNEIADRKADVDAEEARATSAETDLRTAIDAEETRAIEAENTIKAEAFFDADYDSSAKTINFYNKQGEVVDSMDATPFIKDGMIDSVYIDHETKELVIVWNTAAGKEETRIPLSEIFNPEDYYTKAEVDELFNETNTELFRLETILGHKDNDTLVVQNENEAAFGKYNASHTSEDASGQTIFSIGNGTSDDARSNAFEVMKNGDVYMWVEGDYMQINRLLGMLSHEIYDDDTTNNG